MAMPLLVIILGFQAATALVGLVMLTTIACPNGAAWMSGQLGSCCSRPLWAFQSGCSSSGLLLKKFQGRALSWCPLPV